jgi:hypothetical protein
VIATTLVRICVSDLIIQYIWPSDLNDQWIRITSCNSRDRSGGVRAGSASDLGPYVNFEPWTSPLCRTSTRKRRPAADSKPKRRCRILDFHTLLAARRMMFPAHEK